MGFQLVAGHPALDLVNTLDWRFRATGAEELLKTYDDLRRFAEESKLLAPAGARKLHRSENEKTLLRCRELREAVADIFYGDPPSATSRKTLERYFRMARQKQTLDWTQPPRAQWKWPGKEQDPELPLLALAMSAADLLTSEAVEWVRECDNAECRWLFLDTSKNHSRRWCDMKVCGNRMKARRFRAQARG